MRDEEKGGLRALLDICQQLHDLILNGHIQSTSDFIADEHIGINQQGTGNSCPLTFSSTQLVWQPLSKLRCQTNRSQQVMDDLLSIRRLLIEREVTTDLF